MGGVGAGVAILVDRSGGTVDFGAPAKAMLTLNIRAYSPEECPYCKQGLPNWSNGVAEKYSVTAKINENRNR